MAVLAPHIQFNFLVPFPLLHKRKLKTFIAGLFQSENTSLQSLTYIFCSDNYLHQLNVQFLHHDTLTDVITFPLSEPSLAVQGEIYISIERIIDNAAQLHLKPVHELLRVMFHGALHLCGYTDKSVKAKKTMTAKEDYYLSLYSQMFPRGTF